MLEAELEPREVTELTWQEFMSERFRMTPLMSEALATQVRHIRLPYVFWEFGAPKLAMPLIKLQESIEGAFKCPVGQLQTMYRNMVYIDRRSDALHFRALLGELT
jgi:hypothetical protein